VWKKTEPQKAQRHRELTEEIIHNQAAVEEREST
jgi:hypothetical protein